MPSDTNVSSRGGRDDAPVQSSWGDERAIWKRMETELGRQVWPLDWNGSAAFSAVSHRLA